MLFSVNWLLYTIFLSKLCVDLFNACHCHFQSFHFAGNLDAHLWSFECDTSHFYKRLLFLNSSVL